MSLIQSKTKRKFYAIFKRIWTWISPKRLRENFLDIIHISYKGSDCGIFTWDFIRPSDVRNKKLPFLLTFWNKMLKKIFRLKFRLWSHLINSIWIRYIFRIFTLSSSHAVNWVWHCYINWHVVTQRMLPTHFVLSLNNWFDVILTLHSRNQWYKCPYSIDHTVWAILVMVSKWMVQFSFSEILIVVWSIESAFQ